jgi:hypothetical protein
MDLRFLDATVGFSSSRMEAGFPRWRTGASCSHHSHVPLLQVLQRRVGLVLITRSARGAMAFAVLALVFPAGTEQEEGIMSQRRLNSDGGRPR